MKKIAKTKARKLNLSRKTLRRLSDENLRDIGGGSAGSPSKESCWTMCC